VPYVDEEAETVFMTKDQFEALPDWQAQDVFAAYSIFVVPDSDYTPMAWNTESLGGIHSLSMQLKGLGKLCAALTSIHH
jgi:hypothetical protein